MRPLSELDVRVLTFERGWWKYAGGKEQAVRELFDLSMTRYTQVLNALLDNPAALEQDPMLIHRLQRIRAKRTAGLRRPYSRSEAAGGG